MLYLVATPIGNLADITYRAVDTLKSVDMVFCEDTRRTAVLLNHYEIKKPLFAYHQHNENAGAEKIISLLEEGKTIAVVSDAGMPLISDPGNVLVKQLVAHNLPYTVIPGASASLAALALSGLDTGEFYFFGFLPEKNKERDAALLRIKDVTASLIFYVPPHDLKGYLAVLFKAFGVRRCAAVREITKVFEEVVRFNLGEEYTGEIRGEFCLVVEGATKVTENPLNKLEIDQHIAHYQNLGYEKKEAVKLTAKDRGVHKNEIYKETF